MATAMPLLPVELLARIFIECLPTQRYLKPYIDQAPLLLMQVCRQWREIALRTTQLWCSLDATQECWGILQSMRKTQMTGYAGWLSRSGIRPLSLAVQFAWEGKLRQEWIRLLLSYRGRFERLRVVDHHGVDLNKLLDGARMLKFLAVRQEAPPVHDLMIAHPLPSLQTLLLDLFSMDAATLPDATWGNLTRLAVRLPGDYIYRADEFIGLVSRCPNLQVFTFGPFTPESSGDLQLHAPCSHPNLRLLTIVLSNSALLQPASHMLVLPALRLLRVRHEFKHDWEDAVEDQQDAMMPPPPERFFQMFVVRNGDFDMFDVGWANITHLDVTFHGDINIFHTVMELCPNLQILAMLGRHCKDGATSLPTRLTYPALYELFIDIDSPLGNILQMVTLPGLKCLTISVLHCGQHDDVAAMLHRSRCALEKLEVWEILPLSREHWTEQEREALFASLPTLTTLKLYPLMSMFSLM